MTKRLITFRLLAAITSILLMFMGIELLTRFCADNGMQYDIEMWKYALEIKQTAADPVLGHEHAPSRRAKLMGSDFQTNSRGLRDREFPYSRSTGRLRVLMLGDSLTVGWGVAVEDTFSKRLEEMYRQIGVDAEVINAGVGNYNTVQEVEYFLTEGNRYRPDIVVLNFFVNDAERKNPGYSPTGFMRLCYACVFIVGRWDAVKRQYFGKEDWVTYYKSLYENGRSAGWLEAKESLRRLSEYCKTNDIKLVIASLPELHDVKDYRLQSITDLVRQTAFQQNDEFIDVLPHLRGEQSSALWVSAPDPHPNALAHHLIAQALFEALEKFRTSDRKQ